MLMGPIYKKKNFETDHEHKELKHPHRFIYSQLYLLLSDGFQVDNVWSLFKNLQLVLNDWNRIQVWS